MAFKNTLPRLKFGWRDQPTMLENYWDRAMTSIESALDQLTDLITDVQSAQTTANTAQTSADDAQTTANSKISQTTADARYVRQDQTPAYGAVTGSPVLARSQTYYSGQAVSNPPTQAQMQGLDDQVVILNRLMAALITDLKANNTLT